MVDDLRAHLPHLVDQRQVDRQAVPGAEGAGLDVELGAVVEFDALAAVARRGAGDAVVEHPRQAEEADLSQPQVMRCPGDALRHAEAVGVIGEPPSRQRLTERRLAVLPGDRDQPVAVHELGLASCQQAARAISFHAIGSNGKCRGGRRSPRARATDPPWHRWPISARSGQRPVSRCRSSLDRASCQSFVWRSAEMRGMLCPRAVQETLTAQPASCLANPLRPPRWPLHGAQAGRRLASELSPPCARLTMWSVVVAMVVQTGRRMAQTGWSARSSFRFWVLGLGVGRVRGAGHRCER